MISLRKIVITVLISLIVDLPFKVETEYTGSTPVKGASQVKLPPTPPHTHRDTRHAQAKGWPHNKM